MNDFDTLTQRIDALSAQLGQLQQTTHEIRSLVGPFAASLPDGSVLVQTIYGIKYFIDSTDEIMAPQLIVYRQWEDDISRFVVNSMSPDSCFVDIGANFGYFTCLAASRIGTAGTGQVIAAEPNPLMVSLLRRNMGINWSMCPIELNDCAISDHAGYVEFNIPDGRAANASLANTKIAATQGQRRLIVPTKTVADLVAGRRVDLMKIDVEGYEVMVLRGLEPVLLKSPRLALVMEWSQQQMSEADFSTSDFLDVLDRFGYSAFKIPPSLHLERSEMNAFALSRQQLLEIPYDNVLLLRST